MLSGFVLTFAYGRKLADGTLSARGSSSPAWRASTPPLALALVAARAVGARAPLGRATAAFGDASMEAKLVTGVAHATMTHVLGAAPGDLVEPARLVLSASRCGSTWRIPLLVAGCCSARARARRRRLPAAWLAVARVSFRLHAGAARRLFADVDSTAFWLNAVKFTPYATLARVRRRRRARRALAAHAGRARGARFATPLVAGGALAGVAILVARDHIPYTMLHNGTLLPLYAMMAWGLMLGGTAPCSARCRSRPLTALGDSSYVALHPAGAADPVDGARDRRPLRRARPALYRCGAAAGDRAVAIAIHYTLEKRAQAWLRRRPRARRRGIRADCQRRRSLPAPAPLSAGVAQEILVAGSSITSMRKPPAASSTRS